MATHDGAASSPKPRAGGARAIAALYQPPDVPHRQPACAWPHRPAFWRPRHHHGELEFNLVHAGRAVVDVGGRRIEVERGALVWLVPGVHHALVQCSPDFDMWVAAFRMDLVDTLAQERDASPLRAILASAGGAVTLASDAVAAIGERCGAAFRGQSRLGEAMAPALALAARASAGSLAPSIAGKAARKLHADPELGRDALRRAIGVGASTLAHAFKRDLGVGIPEYRARRRLERAVALLDEGRTLLDVALEAGFGSYAQFHRVVTAMTGLSPRALATHTARARLLEAVTVPDVRPSVRE